jgi:hypothetical protein
MKKFRTRDVRNDPRVLPLQIMHEIVDAARGRVLFAVGERMNQNATEGIFLIQISRPFPGDRRANPFRACFKCLIGTLLAVERVYGLIMIACIIKPSDL